jgi:hypothetical protein
MPPLGTREPGCEFLCVDDFISTLVAAQALRSAFEFRLIEYLQQHETAKLDDLEKVFAGDRNGLHLLLDLLAANHVVERSQLDIRLSMSFLTALKYRDLLEAKLEFTRRVEADVSERFSLFLHDPSRFQRESRLFDLFDYGRCLDSSPENRECTRRWLRLTTCLTRYEAAACLCRHDFGRYGNMLDIGGNSGEFVLQICKRYPNLTGTVFDLPVVCDLGREHVATHPEAGRISFVAGNALADAIPGRFDLIAFKSMLHDWPDAEAKRLLTRASHALNPGGTVLIFERAPLRLSDTAVPYSLIPVLLFSRSFRSPSVYTAGLDALGFSEVRTDYIHMEVPFVLITARLLP